MASTAIPPGAARFTPEEVAAFRRAVAGRVRGGLCGAVLRVRADDADVLLAMGDGGSPAPLWAAGKHPDRTYRLVNGSRQALAVGATMGEVPGGLGRLVGRRSAPPCIEPGRPGAEAVRPAGRRSRPIGIGTAAGNGRSPRRTGTPPAVDSAGPRPEGTLLAPRDRG